MANEWIKKLTDENFTEETKKGVTLVDFYAYWCGPCKMLTPILEKVAQDLKDRIVIGKIDIDCSQKVGSQFQVTSVPTLVLLRDGKEIGRLVGLRDVESVKNFVLTRV